MVLDLVSAMVKDLAMAKGLVMVPDLPTARDLVMEKVTALAKERVTELAWAPRHPA